MKFKLHTQIIIALILGAVFGSIFHINQNELEVKSADGKVVIENWSDISFLKQDSLLKSFDSNSQLAVIKYFNSIKDKKLRQNLKLEIKYADREKEVIGNIKEIGKVSTIGVMLKPIGDIFIRLLTMIAVPLVLSSLIVGAASLSDLKHIAKIGGKTIGFYAMTAVIAISIGLACANIIQPGKFMPEETKERLLETYQDDAMSKIDQNISMNIVDFLVNLVPKNPFNAIAEGNFLQIVFFSILTGIFLSQINDDKSKTVINFFDGISNAMIMLVEKIMYIAPIAVFTLISSTVAEFGFSILQTLLLYSVTVIIGLTILTFVEYPLMLKLFTKMDVFRFFKTQRQVIAVAFSTSSSAATLPVTMDICEKKLGVPNKIASFVLPLGTTINMDGTALYQAVAAMFIAQVYGFDLNLTQQLTIVLTAALAAIGTAPVPGIGLIMLIIVLKSVGVPEEGIALIIGVDRLLDMCRTVPNVIADSLACVVIASSEGELAPMNMDG
ncbi:MAG TPA: dicarboxylate/amino acid:cation symporter [Ignavibacteria bacterium]|nr:dicarboxylate/amino acid:cation symporter [Ignavibacteria bacterium]HMR40080.1 dicarboxylate/amino acid:cation symporter [Ignavibacteria bacterium]